MRMNLTAWKLFAVTALLGSAAAACLAADNTRTIYLHAHRGEPSMAPENTVESLKLAFELGSRMVETDFWLSKDGTMVCLHGRREAKKLWGIDKSPSELTLEEIKKSELKDPSKYAEKYAKCKIPDIDDVFAAIPAGKLVELEIKGYGESFARNVDEARKRAGMSVKQFVITSFNTSYIKDFKSKYPEYRTAYIPSMKKGDKRKAKDIIVKAKEAGASEVAIGNYRNIDRDFVKQIQQSGLEVGVWQVENLDDLAYASFLGVNRICSNYACKLRKQYRAIKNLDMQ